jgi:hypothetical protein
MAREYKGSTAYQWELEHYKVPTHLVEKTVAVDTQPVKILSNNPRRLSWVICNRSSTNTAISFTQAVTFESGLLLGANGGTAMMNVMEDGEAVGWEVWGIGETATGVWYVMEVYSV